MKLSAFMTAIKFRKTPEEKEKIIAEHMKHDYVPYEKKADVAKAIIDTCYWNEVKDVNGNTNKVFYVDSVAKHMCTCMALVDLYTDIERQKSDGKMLEDFNTLNGSGILDMILSNIDQRELKEFNMVLQMVGEDAITNEYESHAFISKQVERFGDLVGNVLLPIVGQLDLNKLKEIMDQINKEK